MTPAGPPSEDQALVLELREAFSHAREVLATSASCWVGRDGVARSRSRPSVDTPTLPPGRRLGDFRILEELGRGGMGVVYRARQLSLGRDVALKVLPGSDRHGRRAVQRFRAEAMAASRIHHTNIVAVHGQGEEAGLCFYAMELVEGPGLDEVLKARRAGATDVGWSGPRDLARQLAAVADGLQAAHDAGVIHRDVKPHNVIFGRDRFFLTDFGLARLEGGVTITVPGERMGTPAYRSPEQVRGEAAGIDHRTDVYSFGVMLYELLTGVRPFERDDREAIGHAILNDTPMRPRRIDASVPRPLEAICLRAMARDPRDRYATAAALSADLRSFAEGLPLRSRRPALLTRVARSAWRHRRAMAAGLAVVVIATAVLGWNAAEKEARAEVAHAAVDRAWDRIVFLDYRRPEGAAADLAEAADAGAEGMRWELLQGLTAIGEQDYPRARAIFADARLIDPNDPLPAYLEAWAHEAGGDRAAAVALWDTLPEPPTAEGWFFRGLAIHRARPRVAEASYQRAVELRLAEQDIFPQAMLHLARSRNQRAYAERDITGHAETVERLEQLADLGVYGAYPHYLLSIAFRLAGDIEASSSDSRAQSRVATFYDEALRWAEAGQVVDPTDDRPVTAEAECLESLHRYDDAIDARDRAIDLADRPMGRWEGFHYRWRLRYWQGQVDGALADLAVCATFDPSSVFYRAIYPALVLADHGDRPAALELLREEVAAEPESAVVLLHLATAFRFVGAAEEAVELLSSRRARVRYDMDLVPPQDGSWMEALFDHAIHGDGGAALEALASDETPWIKAGEEAYHEAGIQFALGNVTVARQQLGRAFHAFNGERAATYHAKTLLRRLDDEPEGTWPWWPGQLRSQGKDAR